MLSLLLPATIDLVRWCTNILPSVAQHNATDVYTNVRPLTDRPTDRTTNNVAQSHCQVTITGDARRILPLEVEGSGGGGGGGVRAWWGMCSTRKMSAA